MRPDMGAGAIVLFVLAVIAVTVFYAVRGIVRYAKRREAERKELLDLLRKQSEIKTP